MCVDVTFKRSIAIKNKRGLEEDCAAVRMYIINLRSQETACFNSGMLHWRANENLLRGVQIWFQFQTPHYLQVNAANTNSVTPEMQNYLEADDVMTEHVMAKRTARMFFSGFN